ncbi:MAG: 2-oxo acid dehydrogenase subunit E2 [Deltaproteobacteria bacterium]|nr:MAG: 2-oxo acid dehydrogenase subunit E2 [Deltaproteobacteria bacterium]
MAATPPAAPSAERPTGRSAGRPEGVGLPPLTWQGRPINPAIMEIPRHFTPDLDRLPPPRRGRLRASPAARHAARQRGIDLALVTGTGPRGRITRKDVLAFRAPASGIAPPSPAPRGDTTVPHSQMRKTIARRLTGVWRDAPVFYLTATLACDRLVDLRSQLKEAGWTLSYNDMLIKAVALALRQVPEVNASWGDSAITRHGDVHIGMAVALEDGLITPVLRDADRKDLQAIAAETRDLAARARDRKLQPHEYQGSTFTVSNLGMMGIDHFTAILNPPEAAILAVGGLQREAAVVDGEGGGRLSTAWRMRVTMTCDHRVIDGALGARFLQALRRNVESPALLLA